MTSIQYKIPSEPVVVAMLQIQVERETLRSQAQIPLGTTYSRQVSVCTGRN